MYRIIYSLELEIATTGDNASQQVIVPLDRNGQSKTLRIVGKRRAIDVRVGDGAWREACLLEDDTWHLHWRFDRPIDGEEMIGMWREAVGEIAAIERAGGDPCVGRKLPALLAEAGYPDGRGFPPVTLLISTSQWHRQIAEVLQQHDRKLR